MKPKPPCPTCKSSNVKTLGGGTHGKYRYFCEETDCGTCWQQTPLHRNTEDEVEDDISVIESKNAKRNDTYKCGRCGQLKKGHTCTMVDGADKRPTLPKHFSPNGYIPPTPSLFPAQEISLPFQGFTNVPPPPNSILSFNSQAGNSQRDSQRVEELPPLSLPLLLQRGGPISSQLELSLPMPDGT
jgi:hypothetical protein